MKKIRSVGLTDVGRVRSNNEDAFACDEALGFFAVADGVGGAPGGEVVSAAAIAASRAEVERGLLGLARPVAPNALVSVARRAVEAACKAAYDVSHTPDTAGAATTLTVLVVDGACGAMAHVGDSRLYSLRGGRLETLSIDHSVSNELLRAGLIGADEARRHSLSHVLSRSLGPHRSVIVETLPLHLVPGATLILATDGLNEALEEPEVVGAIAQSEDLAAVGRHLIEAANRLGGRDNATVVLVNVNEPTSDPRASAVELMRGVAPFSGLDLASRARIVGAGSVETWDAGATLLEEHQSFGGLWVVVTGSVCWSGATSAELESGDWFGEAALLKETVCPATVVAKTAVTMFRLPAVNWAKLSRRRPLLGLSVLQRLAATLLIRQPAPVPNRAAPPR